VAAFAAAALVPGWGPEAARAEPVLPDFSAATFEAGQPIDNPFFPLTPNTRYRYSGIEFDDEDPGAGGEPIVIEVTVTTRTKVIDGVRTREVRELEWVGGLLVEDTTDHFAQDTDGNVWYFEEETAGVEYDDEGNEIGRDTGGSWKHGVNGARATHIMPASTRVGDMFYVEFAPNEEVLDVAEVLALNESLATPFDEYDGVRKFRIIDVPEPEEFEDKYFAPGIGRVFVETDFGDDGVPLNSIALERVTVIPLPPAFLPALGVLAATGLIGRLRRRLRGRARG
jgi:hypothetical protein